MGLFKTLFNVVMLPVAVVKDVVSLGGIVTERDESYTREQCEKIDDEMSD